MNESSLFQHSFLIHYLNGNIFFITHIYIIPFGYCKSQTKSNYFRSIDYISKYSHQKFRTQGSQDTPAITGVQKQSMATLDQLEPPKAGTPSGWLLTSN